MFVFAQFLILVVVSPMVPTNIECIEVSVQEPQSRVDEQIGEVLKEQVLGSGLGARESAASQVLSEQFGRQISAVEWLAPLAPVALSPFFGITLLSGLACFGTEWLPSSNALLSDNSPLANPTLFWVFLVLTVVTSVPRFSKASKTISQLADFLETYSAIVILVVLKFAASLEIGVVQDSVAQQAGILAVGWDGFIAIAMATNLIVINAVKFFFETLVWITPIPFLDACFEIANKTLCAALMAIYAFSPMLALALNILIFIACLFVFAWMKRREVFYRTILIAWLVGQRSNSVNKLPAGLVVFPKRSIGRIPARAKCLIERTDEGWLLTQRRFFGSPRSERISGTAQIASAWWTFAIHFSEGQELTMGRRYASHIQTLAEQMDWTLVESESRVDQETSRQIEFA